MLFTVSAMCYTFYSTSVLNEEIGREHSCFWLFTNNICSDATCWRSTLWTVHEIIFQSMEICLKSFFRFGDLYGGRAALVLAFVSSTMTYGTLGFAYSIPVLFFSRAMSVFMHAMQGRVF